MIGGFLGWFAVRETPPTPGLPNGFAFGGGTFRFMIHSSIEVDRVDKIFLLLL